MPEIIERTSCFERVIGKTWFVQQSWKTTETNKPCSYSDLVNSSFLLLKYAQCIMCFIIFGQQEDARLFVMLFFHADA